MLFDQQKPNLIHKVINRGRPGQGVRDSPGAGTRDNEARFTCVKSDGINEKMNIVMEHLFNNHNVN